MGTPRIIKKHANRRLYDIHRKCYISLDQVRELINSAVDPFLRPGPGSHAPRARSRRMSRARR